jgi:hypothetical protein
MEQIKRGFFIAQGSNDVFLRIGFCPDFIKIVEHATGLEILWFRLKGNDQSVTCVAAGDRTVSASTGITIGHMAKIPYDMTADTDFTAFTDANWLEDGKEANAVKISSDTTGLTDHAVMFYEAHRMGFPAIRAVHDGGDNKNTYFQDASIDFEKLGVVSSPTDPTWLLYNVSNNNYAHIGAVQKVTDKANKCRLTLVTAAGAAVAAADIDDGDIALILPIWAAQYPLGDYGHMT